MASGATTVAALARLAIGLAVLAAFGGCVSPRRLPAVPSDRTSDAVVPGVPGARYYLRDDLDRWMQDSIDSGARWVEAAGEDTPVHFLAISGGGDKGAFGAGLLLGWTAAGTRPEFQVVTGISTGALTAPFAFLGPDYDPVLRAVYTNVTSKDILDARFLPRAALFDDAMADSSPLRKLIDRYVTPELLEAVAHEYEERGRWLMVVSTNLDSRRPVIWNLGKVAAARNEQALELFRKVLLASASIPGAFPPVMLDVELDGEPHQEMHVDGGAVAQTFLFPPSFVIAAKERDLVRDVRRHAWIIRNARLDPQWAAVERRTLSILGRSMSTLLQSQGQGDLLRLYVVADAVDMDFNLAYIPRDFDRVPAEQFDREFMRELFQHAYDLSVAGYPWAKRPPGLESTLTPSDGVPAD